MNLTIESSNSEKMLIRIYDMKGELVFKSQSYLTNEQVPLGKDLLKGIYMVQIIYGDKMQTVKIVKE